MIQAIIFDYGNVIFNIDHQLTIEAFKKLGVQKDAQFFGHLGQDPIFDRFEKGEITPAEFREGIRKIAGMNLSDAEIDEAWNALLIGIPDGYLDLLLQVKSKYPSYLLSNNNQIHYDWILNYLKKQHQVNDMSAFFHKDYYSHLMGMRKPNADIFEFVLEQHQLKAQNTLFIDDSPQHIKTANALGIQTHLMLKTENLKDVLSRYIAL